MNTGEDKLVWCGNLKGVFSVQNCHEVNNTSINPIDGILNKLWKAHIQERLKVFTWRVLADTLPFKDLLSARLRLGDASCIVCGANVESTFHILKEFPESKAIVFSSKWGAKIDGWPRDNTGDLIELCLNPPRSIWDGFLAKENL